MCLIFSGVPDFFRHGLDVPEKIRHCLKKSGTASYNRKKCVRGQGVRGVCTIVVPLCTNFSRSRLPRIYIVPDSPQIRARLVPD